MTGQLDGFSTRERLGALWTADAIRLRRREYVGLSLAWVGMGVAVLAHSGRPSVFGITQVVAGLTFAARAIRLRPRPVDSFSEQEIASAERESVKCPRCGRNVLTLERRCVQCGSRSFHFAFSSGGRIIVLLVTLAAIGAFIVCWMASP